MNKYIFILIASLTINFTACTKSFLDVEDNSVILAEQYVSDLTTTQHYLNGVYMVLRKQFYHGNYQIYPDLIADNIKPAAGKSTLLTQYNWQQLPLTENMNSIWLWGYQLAGSCSFVIEKAAEFKDENPAKARQIQAEAYSIRALLHFVLVNVFAQSYNYTNAGSHPGIPYKKTFDWTQSVTRSSVSEVYAAMITDLNQAIGLFSTTNNTTLVMNKMAAKALLARLYLYMEDWQQAKNIATEVTQAVPLMTGNSYPSKLFTLEETEALFQLAPHSNAILGGSSADNTLFQGRFLNNGRSTLFLATIDIAGLLKQNEQDVRKSWVKSGGIGKDTIVKYPVNVINGFPTKSDSYYPTILRSSEMYLTVAEASAKLGDENTAKIYLDAIRQRAIATAANSTASGTALLDSICLERRRELAFEGLRMFDLQRWKKDVKRSDPITPNVSLLTYPNDKAIAPIPLIDAQNGIPQNPGYK